MATAVLEDLEVVEVTAGLAAELSDAYERLAHVLLAKAAGRSVDRRVAALRSQVERIEVEMAVVRYASATTVAA